jgi:hypothetical protein
MRNRFYCRPNSVINQVIAAIMIIGGLILIIAFTPLWIWLIVIGTILVVLGILILFAWRL